MLRTVKPEVKAADEVPQDQGDNADIIIQEPAVSDLGGVVQQGVVQGRRRQADQG